MAVNRRTPEQRFKDEAERELEIITDHFERLRRVAERGGHTEAQRETIVGGLQDEVQELVLAFRGERARRIEL